MDDGSGPNWAANGRNAWIKFGRSFAGQGSNLQPPDSKSGVLPVELPATVFQLLFQRYRLMVQFVPLAARVRTAMGSLIKKRRKRMRKKKHRKLLKRTRVQRRNKK